MIMSKRSAVSQHTSPQLDRRLLEREWERFVFGNKESFHVRPLMQESWRRCKEMGMGPFHKTSINLSKDQLGEYLLADPTLQSAKPVLAKLKNIYMDAGHLVVFTNHAGEIVYMDGELPLMLKAEDGNLVPGAAWSENRAGTNAIGSAIVTGRPVQVFAGEHYCQEIQNWTCTAAPIHDPATRQLLGVIDLTSLWTGNHLDLLSVVASAANDVHGMLRSQLQWEHMRLMEYYHHHCLSRPAQQSYLAVIDRGWRVITASPTLYELGLVTPAGAITGAPVEPLSLTARRLWETEHLRGSWRFELTPYIYGGIPIGAIIHIIPPQLLTQTQYFAPFDPTSTSNTKERIRSTTFRARPASSISAIPDFYKSLFEHHPDGIYVCDLDGKLLAANPTMQRIIGHTEEELRGFSLQSLLLPEFHEVNARMTEKMMQGKPQIYDAAIMHKQGLRIDIEINSFPMIIDNENENVGCYGIVKDRTRSKCVEEDLQSAKQQLELFLSNTVDAIMIFDLRKNVTKVNQAFEEMFGWTEQEVLGRSFPIVTDALDYSSSLQQALEGRHVVTFETTKQRKDGSLIEVSCFFSPIVDGKGNVTAFVSILRDITEHRRMEEALKESEKRLRDLINALPDMVIFKDEEGRWLEANDHAISSFQFENVAYRGLTDIELAARNERYRDTLLNNQQSDQETWAKRQITRKEEIMRRTDDKSVILDMIKVPMFYPDGRRKGLVMIGRDITDLKQTEELLRKSEKLAVIGQLSAGIAHEIRNPLTSLKGFLSLLQSSIEDKNKWYSEVMVSELNRIQAITNQFMAVAKPQALMVQDQDLRQLIEQVSVIISPEATMNNIQMLIEAEDDLPSIQCEVNQLKQVFINILKNAIEAMPSGGDIQIYIRRLDSGFVQFRCTDQGCGIPEERLPHLGEPFYSLKEKGTGLGLMMCFKIIEEHHGQIAIQSEIGKGTTVDVMLPADASVLQL